MQADRCAVLRHSARSFASALLPVAMLAREASLLLLDWLLAAAVTQPIDSHVVQQQCHPHAVGVLGAFVRAVSAPLLPPRMSLLSPNSNDTTERTIETGGLLSRVMEAHRCLPPVLAPAI